MAAFTGAVSCVVVVLLASVVAPAAAASGDSVFFSVRNEAAHTAGGRRFEVAVGAAHARDLMEQATNTAWSMLGQQANSKDRRQLKAIALVVLDAIAGGGMVATSRAGRIELDARLVGTYNGDVKKEVTGVLYREMAKIWQADGQGRANAAIIDGVADLARIRAGYVPATWVQPGDGDAWNQRGSGVTARFLEHLDKQHDNFIASLNRGLNKPTTGDELFEEITGKSVEKLWAAYKAAYTAA